MSTTDVFGSEETRRFPPSDGVTCEEEKEPPVDGKSTRTSRESAERAKEMLVPVPGAYAPGTPGLGGIGLML